MSSLAILAELPDVSYHNDWNSVKQALQNWSVRDKFTYKTPCKDGRRARYICTAPGCIFRVTGNKDRSGRITLKVVNRRHTCMQITTPHDISGTGANSITGDPITTHPPLTTSNVGDKDDLPQEYLTLGHEDQKHRNPASQMKWLVTAVERVLDVTAATKPADIQVAVKEFYNEQISYQQAFRCLRLLTADIKEQGHRERVPDELRKAIVTLRVFVDPPMDWTEIEHKTGVKARTAGYVFASAVKKSGGSRDPLVLLKNATLSISGPKAWSKTQEANGSNEKHPSDLNRPSADFSTSQAIPKRTSLSGRMEESIQLQKRRKRNDGMIDPSLDVAMELTRAAAETEDGDVTEEVIEENNERLDENHGINFTEIRPSIAIIERTDLSKQPGRCNLPPSEIILDRRGLDALLRPR